MERREEGENMRKKGKKRQGERGGRKQGTKEGREGEKLVGGEIL